MTSNQQRRGGTASLGPNSSRENLLGQSRKSGYSRAAKKSLVEELDDDDDPVDDFKEKKQTATNNGPSLRAIIPQIINEQNRKTYGTWQRQFDFTRTIIGYLLGIHNFFRFPYLCYKFGGVFLIPYVILMIIVGIPIVFMEFTIGQYYGVGSFVAFTHMSPILGGVSKLLTWSCVVNCWMYTLILAWLRIYSNDATSCLKGWEICDYNHYYNTPHCYTGALDDECNDLSMAGGLDLKAEVVLKNEMLFYNYRCRSLEYYCEAHGWKVKVGAKACVDEKGKRRSIYERRHHATEEFFHGAVLGLQRKSERIRDGILLNEALRLSNLTNVTDLVEQIYGGLVDSKRMRREKDQALDNSVETVRRYLKYLQGSPDPVKQQLHKTIEDRQTKKQYQDKYWTKKGQHLVEDPSSSSFKELQSLSMTTWIMIAVFLFEDLLKISFLSYILNAVPFMILIYVTAVAAYFEHSGHGIEQIFRSRKSFLEDLAHMDMWSEAVIQVIYTTGIGNGVLLSLATFNNLNHNYTIDLYATLILCIVTSCCGVLVAFCSLGHYIQTYNIDIPFQDYIKANSVSSVEFCMIVYSIFLTLISDQNVIIILFFFMLTSFATDTAIRLVQCVLDTFMDSSARFKHHSTMMLVAVCSMGYLLLVPAMRNGAFILFVNFEYFTLRYVMPAIVLVEAGACVFVYKASRIIDHSEQMGVFSSWSYRSHMLVCMYLSFFAILITIILNVINYTDKRFNGSEMDSFLGSSVFGWVLVAAPLLMLTLSVVKQLIVLPQTRWRWLLMPLKGKDRKVRRAFLRRIQGAAKNRQDQTDQEDIRDAALKWRKLESQLVMAIMEKRKAERAKKEGNEGDDQKKNEQGDGLEQTPLFQSLVKVVAAEKKKEDAFPEDDVEDETVKFDDEKIGDEQSDLDENDRIRMDIAKQRSRRMAFIHVKKESFFGKLLAAFMGKAAMHGKSHRPKRRPGGGVRSRIVTRQNSEGEKIVNLEEEEEDSHESDESVSHDEEHEDLDEKLREKYLDAMDYVERWPGRLDESEIESEGSSLEDEEEEIDEIF